MGSCVWYISKYVVRPIADEPAGRSFGLMREMVALGHQGVIVTSDSMGMLNAPEAEDAYFFEVVEGMRLCRIRTLKYSASKSFRRILSWLHFEWRLLRIPMRSLPEPDVVIASSLSLLTVLNGLRLRRRYRCRLVFEVRDIWPLTLTEEGGFSRWNPVVACLGAIERLGYRRADIVVGTMPNLGEHIEKVTGQDIPAHCVPMGVDGRTVQSPGRLPEDYVNSYIPQDRFVVGYAGSIGITNALDTLMECAEQMKDKTDVHFVVVGDGDLRLAYIDQFGSLPNITFAPRVAKAMVQDFLTRCDLLYLSVHDSVVWRYGLSLNKMIDYMLSGKPIVASYSGFPSMITEAECGSFVPAGDVAALRREIERYHDMDPVAREAMGERGRGWLLANRDYEVLAEEYLRILFPSPSVR